jgi:thioredoxin-related protein
MKKILLLVLFTVGLYANNLTFAQAMKKAEENNKYLIAVLKTQYCPYCDKLMRDINQDIVKEKLSKKYIVVTIDRDKDDFPRELYSRLVPMTYFINPKNRQVIEQITGYVNPWQFMDIASKTVK